METFREHFISYSIKSNQVSINMQDINPLFILALKMKHLSKKRFFQEIPLNLVVRFDYIHVLKPIFNSGSWYKFGSKTPENS